MNMDIEKLIPDKNDSNWYINHNTIYFRKGGSIPVLKKIDDIYYISLDFRIRNKVIKTIEHLNSLELDFFLCDRMTISEKHIYQQDIEGIIRNYLLALGDEVFFKFIQKTEFDYIRNLTNFLNLYDSHTKFKTIYDYLKKNHFEKLWMDWYTRTEHYQVKNEEIRFYYSILERQIKLNLFFD